MSAEPTTASIGHLGDAALVYGHHGVHVFPCQPRGKTPLPGLKWADQATTNLDRIADWWIGTPDANIAIPLGPNGVFVVDVDGPDARAHLDRLQQHNTALPDTYRVRTGRAEGDGLHYVFRQPVDRPAVRNRKIDGNPKLETRGDGGYVIAPPSIHASGRTYLAVGAWSQIAEAPVWLLDYAAPNVDTSPASLPPQTADGHHDDRAARSFKAAVGRVAIETETRNNLLFWASAVAGSLAAAGRLDRDRAVAELERAADLNGLTADDGAAATAKTIRSGLESGALQPEYDTPSALHSPPAGVTINQPDRDDGGGVLSKSERVVGLPIDLDQLDPEDPLHRAVLDEYVRLVARRQAQQVDVALTAPEAPPPVSLTDLLAQPDPELVYRLEGLWPQHGRALLAAQFKSGKTTLVGNLIRSLVDETPFLGTFPPAPLDSGRVFLIDDELHQDTLRRWYRDFGIVNTDAVETVCLRGRTSTFNILDAHVRTTWANAIRQAGATVVVFDCLRPILDALGLSEDKDAGRFLVAFDELLYEAGVTEALVVHHMGHGSDRSRGDSRLRDWPDVEWRLIRDDDEGVDDPSAARYFVAYGRDVDHAESRLEFDGSTRALTIGGGSRRQEKTLGDLLSVCNWVETRPGCTQSSVAQGACNGNKRKASRVLDEAQKRGLVEDRSPDSVASQHWYRTPKGIT